MAEAQAFFARIVRTFLRARFQGASMFFVFSTYVD